MADPTPIASPIWLAPMWKPVRPFCLSRVEATLGEGESSPGYPAEDLRVQVVMAQDPKDGLGAGYVTIAEVVLDCYGGTAPMQRRAVAEVSWPFGPRVIPAGWWVAACHNISWRHHPDEEAPGLSLQLHGTDL